MILNSGHKIIINVAALALLAAAISFLVIIPTVNNIKETAKEIYELRTYLEKKYQDSLKTRLTKKKLEQIKQNSADLPAYLFNAVDTLKLIQILETTAANNKVSQKINYSNLDKIKPQTKIKIDLTISGQYLNILNYVQALESMTYFVNIENIRLTPVYNNSGQATNDASANLTIGIYVNQ